MLGTVGGLLPALVHALTTASEPAAAAGLLTSGVLVVTGIGMGQGIAATATALARSRGEHYVSPRRGFAGALAVGAFNGLMYFLQMAVPATELGWGPDLLILLGVGAAAGWAAVRLPDKDSVAVASGE